jgi:hypothetical protein
MNHADPLDQWIRAFQINVGHIVGKDLPAVNPAFSPQEKEKLPAFRGIPRAGLVDRIN